MKIGLKQKKNRIKHWLKRLINFKTMGYTLDYIKDYLQENVFNKPEYQNYLDKYEITIDKVMKLFENALSRKDHLGNILQEYYQKENEILVHPKNIDWDNKESESYKEYDSYNDVSDEVYKMKNVLVDMYIEKYGKYRTLEEAGTVLADKMCELLFKWHLQDNGALDEEHSFMASALATVLGNNAKEKITKEQQEKAHDLIRDYAIFCGKASSVGVGKSEADKWKEIIKLNFFHSELYSDYGPNTMLYNILKHAGIEEDLITSICPWKTGLEIDYNDNSVMYRTYGKIEYI